MLDATSIRNKVNIVDIISQYLKINKQGRNHVALCPFHADSNPSMMISQDKQIFKCFVCGAGGNVFSFVQLYEKISFSAAIKKVAFLAGIVEEDVVENVDPEIVRLAKVNELAYRFFSYYLKNIADNHEIISYLKNRGIDENLIDKFKLGYAPPDNSLIDFLRKNGAKDEDICLLGIGYYREGVIYSRFRERLMFAITFNNKIVGFSGRIINNSNEAKYVNSSESVLFIKNEILYNYDVAKVASMKARKLYLVEGFMDVIALAKAGIDNVCATMGTALTNQHIRLLRLLNSEIILTFDGDNAGQMAIINSIEKIGEQITVSAIDYQSNADPDEIYMKEGKAALLAQLAKTIDPVDFYFKYYLRDIEEKTIKQREQIITTIIKKIATITGISRSEYLRKLSMKTGIEYQDLADYSKMFVKTIEHRPTVKTKSNRFFQKNDRRDIIAKAIIWMLCNNEDGKKYLMAGNLIDFHDEIYFLLSQYIYKELAKNNGKVVDVADIITELDKDDVDGNAKAKSILLEIFETNSGVSGKSFQKVLDKYKQSKTITPQSKGSLDDQFEEQAAASKREYDTYSFD